MQHTRASLNRIIPKVGDGLYDNERRKLLEIVEDTTEGVHDTLIAACDDARYKELGGGEGHRNCADNLVEGLGALGWFLSSLFSTSLIVACLIFLGIDFRLMGLLRGGIRGRDGRKLSELIGNRYQRPAIHAFAS